MIDGDNAEILVRNQGKTIPEHQLNNLFEKFYRLDEARSSENWRGRSWTCDREGDHRAS